MRTPSWLVADADPDEVSIVHLVVEVLPAHRSSRWSWHLIDRRDGSRFETGFEYDSASAARRAGLSRLAELTSAVPTVATHDAPWLSTARRVALIDSESRLRAA